MEWTHAIKFSYDEKAKALRMLPAGPLEFTLSVPEKQTSSVSVIGELTFPVHLATKVAVLGCKEVKVEISPVSEGDIFFSLEVSEKPVEFMALRMRVSVPEGQTAFVLLR